VGAFADQGGFIDPKRIAFDNLEPLTMFLLQLAKRREAAAVALDGYDGRAGVEQCPGETPGPRPYFIDSLALKLARNCGDTRQ
jgi:hypothetical protein